MASSALRAADTGCAYHSPFAYHSPQADDLRVHTDIRLAFGKRLCALRKKRGWTQAEMAHYLGLDRSYVGEIEQGKRNPCLLNLKVIADGLKISLSKLFSGLK